MTVLITGGTGFIGANVAKRLVAEGEKVVLFELAPNLKLIDGIADSVELIRGDVANWAEVLDVVKSYDVKEIYHTAALLSDNAEKNPLRAYQVNSTGTWHVLEAARLFGAKVIFTSTAATYGDHVGDVVTNDSPQFPRIIYGSTKVACERLGEYYFYRFGVNFRGIRFPSVIGPGRGGGGVSTYTTLAVQNPALGLPYDIFVAPESTLPVMYIDDAVNAMVTLARVSEDKLTRRMYIAAGAFCTAQELVNEVKRVLPDAVINFTPDQDMVDIVSRIPNMDDSVAREDWGWKSTLDNLPALVEKFIKDVQLNRTAYL